MSTSATEWVGGGVYEDKRLPHIAKSVEQYDVAIIGAGYEGAMLGLILAHQGVKVLIIESGIHPRFALGESTVRHTFRMLKIIGERYGIPEIQKKFSSGEQVHKYVTSSCGEKRNFGFVYHRKGEHQRPDEANQLVIPPFREGYEAHLFRQDIDSFLTYCALHYGATVKFKTMITEVETGKQGVTVRSSKGDMFKARYLVDASGSNSVLARLFNLKDETPRFKLQSRCLFNHVIDVKPYDDLTLPFGVPRAPERWYNGTCHHIFDGGWVWVIPFDNREGATNPVVSVGVSFDMKKYPKPKDMTPDQEWQWFLSTFPSVNEQFKDSKPVRDWVSSDRLQVSCKTCIGERFVLMASAYGAGFIDALFSRGLANSTEVINALAPRLLKALKDDDFSPERFEYIQQVQENNRINNDHMVNSAYVCFHNFEMWNAWFRIWALAVGLGDLRLASIYRRYLESHDESILPDNEAPMGLFFSNHEGFRELFLKAVNSADEFEAGRISSSDCARRIFDLLADCKFTAPATRLADPATRYVNVGAPATLLRTFGWVLTSAPQDIKAWTMSTLGPLRHFGPKVKASTGVA